jgi:hypothetical protein
MRRSSSQLVGTRPELPSVTRQHSRLSCEQPSLGVVDLEDIASSLASSKLGDDGRFIQLGI